MWLNENDLEVRNLMLPRPGYVAYGKLLTDSQLQFPHLVKQRESYVAISLLLSRIIKPGTW